MRGLFLMVLLSACSGEILARSGGVVRPVSAPVLFDPPAATLRMLTASQYQRATVQLGAPFESAPPLLPTSAVAASAAVASDSLVHDFEARALRVAKALAADATWREGNSSCALTQATCRRSTVQALGARAFRRALTADEVEDYAALFESETARFADANRGLEFVLAALLQSPQFIYRVELEDGAGHFDGPALASRLSFLLTNAPPDASLRRLAEDGQLADGAVRRAQAERLLGLEEGRVGVRRFFEDWLQLDKVARLEKSAERFPLFSQAMPAAMREQAMRAAEAIVFERGDARALFEDQGADINAVLAPLYGQPAPTGNDWVHLTPQQTGGPRPGLLGWPALLALHAKPTKTSVTERGVFLRTEVLCSSVPQPPDVFPPLPVAMPGEQLTTRRLFERHRAVEPCKSCHSFFDPLGITLETYDGIGVVRTLENGLPIDPSGEFDGVPVADVTALAKVISQRPDALRCVVQKLHSYAAGTPWQSGDSPWVASLFEGFKAGGYDVRKLLGDYVASDEFALARSAP
jgi:hypothetical protein